MGQYNAPLRDMHFVLHELLDAVPTLRAMPAHEEVDAETINAILQEAARFSADILAPINLSGDLEGCTHRDNGVVTTPSGFKEAYRQYVDAGWPALNCDPAYGGQDLPFLIKSVVSEMLCAANQAWTAYPGLSYGAYECLHAHGSPAQRTIYVTKLTSGTWTGTMCLTEPHCGTDLGLIRTKAQPEEDNSYSITGTKIFISGGEHDMAENIVHLVLARLPDAPAGTKGISLFIVPKFIPDPAGNPGQRNGIVCGSIEHKMGIHGNSTCEMNLDGARGWLVGAPNKGLNAMFVMMNTARLGVGIQCVGLADFSYRNSLAYALDRHQMRGAAGQVAPDKPADPIIVHPDVRRMLLTQKAYVEAGRALTYWTALEIDKENSHPDQTVRAAAADHIALLTPVIKAFISDNTFECTNHAMQIFGGHGYIHASGMEQYVRDARLNSLYEGTNGVQALDLLGRKVLADGGARLKGFGKVVQNFLVQEAGNADMREFCAPLLDLAGKVIQLTEEIRAKALKNPNEVGAASPHYLRVLGHLTFAYLWAQMARIALARKDSNDPFYSAKLATARFYFTKILPETTYQIAAIQAGSAPLMDMQADQF